MVARILGGRGGALYTYPLFKSIPEAVSRPFKSRRNFRPGAVVNSPGPDLSRATLVNPPGPDLSRPRWQQQCFQDGDESSSKIPVAATGRGRRGGRLHTHRLTCTHTHVHARADARARARRRHHAHRPQTGFKPDRSDSPLKTVFCVCPALRWQLLTRAGGGWWGELRTTML